MLSKLRDYTRQRSLASEPGFKSKTIAWLIRFREDGSFVDVVAAANLAQRTFLAPHLSQAELLATGKGTRQFLVDGLDVVAVWTGKTAVDPDDDAKQLAKHDGFIAHLRQAGGTVASLAVFANALSDPGTLLAIRADLARQKPKPKPVEIATLALVDADGTERIPLAGTEWHPWWRAWLSRLVDKRTDKKTAKSDGQSTSRMRCLMSGELVTPVSTHPKINGLADVGGHSAGDALVSFDKEAFTSFGLAQSSNAAMSADAAGVYATALNSLIRDHGRSVRIAGTRILFWYSGPTEIPPELDPLAWLFAGGPPRTSPSDLIPSRNADEDAADELADTLFRPRELTLVTVPTVREAFTASGRDDVHHSRCHGLILSGNLGRVILLDEFDLSMEQLVTGVDRWFAELAWETTLPTEHLPKLAFLNVLKQTLPERRPEQSYEKWLAPLNLMSSVVPALLRCVLDPTRPFPRTLARNLLDRHAQDMASHRFGPTRGGQATDSSTDPTRPRNIQRAFEQRMRVLSLLNARQDSNSRWTQNGQSANLTQGLPMARTGLDVKHPRAAYQIGRLMAVLEMIQKCAQGDVGTTIAKTHYATAATRPLIALPRLETLTQHHLPKISPKLRRQYERLLVEIKGRLPSSLPRTFDLEDQTLFHLGYYHQKPYRPYTSPPPKHRTLRGELVRSKSEVIVANLLAWLKMDYQYETVLTFDRQSHQILPTGTVGANVGRLRPDFTILSDARPTPILIEHLGMLDNETYRRDWKARRKQLARLGIEPVSESHPRGGSQGLLIVTREERGVIDSQRLESELKSHLSG